MRPAPGTRTRPVSVSGGRDLVLLLRQNAKATDEMRQKRGWVGDVWTWVALDAAAKTGDAQKTAQKVNLTHYPEPALFDKRGARVLG